MAQPNIYIYIYIFIYTYILYLIERVRYQRVIPHNPRTTPLVQGKASHGLRNSNMRIQLEILPVRGHEIAQGVYVEGPWDTLFKPTLALGLIDYRRSKQFDMYVWRV